MTEYYIKINIDESNDLWSNNAVGLSKSRIDKLKPLLDKFSVTIQEDTSKRLYLQAIDISNNLKRKTFDLIELDDEWFLVNFWMSLCNRHFKCDQFDGVIKLLEDEKIILNN